MSKKYTHIIKISEIYKSQSVFNKLLDQKNKNSAHDMSI